MTTNADGPPSLTTLAALVDASTDPLARLARIAALATTLAVVERTTVAEARTDGHTYAAIGATLGISKQAVSKRVAPTALEATAAPPRPPKQVREPNKGWEVTTPGGRSLFHLRRLTSADL